MSLEIIRKPEKERTLEDLRLAFEILYKSDGTKGRIFTFENVKDVLNKRLKKFLMTSKSRIGTKGFCKYQIKCVYLYGIPVIQTYEMKLGTNIHWVIEMFWNSVKPEDFFDLNDYKEIYVFIFEKCIEYIPKKERTKMVILLITNFVRFESYRIMKIYLELGKSKNVIQEYVIPLYHELGIENWDSYLNGFVDRIERLTNDKIILRDYKSGKPKYYHDNKYDKENIEIEMGFYKLLFQGDNVYVLVDNHLKHIDDVLDFEFNDIEHGSILYFQDPKTFESFRITDEMLVKTLEEIDDYWYMVNNGLFYPKPKRNCVVKKMDVSFLKEIVN